MIVKDFTGSAMFDRYLDKDFRFLEKKIKWMIPNSGRPQQPKKGWLKVF